VDRSVAYVQLGPDECWSLLRRSAAGRVVFTHQALPSVALVNYALVGDLIVFGVGERSKLSGLLDGQVVAFEVDDVDPSTGTGWSVLVVGRSARVADADITRRLPPLALYPSSLDGPNAYVGVTGEKITGRVWDGFDGLLIDSEHWEATSDRDPRTGRP